MVNVNFDRVWLKMMIWLTAVMLIAGCRTYHPSPPTSDIEEEQFQPVMIPDTVSDGVYADLFNREAVISFYSQSGFMPAWFDSAGRPTASDSMVMIIRNTRYFGLLPQQYHLAEIDTLLSRPYGSIPRMDVLLTDAFFELLADLKGPSSLTDHPLDSIGVVILQDAIRTKSLLRSLKSVEPAYSQYQKLKVALASILDTANTHTRSGILAGEVNQTDPTMKLVQTIELNLERWRAEKQFTEAGKYIFVNVPAFMLTVVNDGNVVIESRVIVGAPKTPTPDITSKLECFMIYPYWHVPRRIAVEEYLPVIKRDTSFISRNNFDVLDRKGRILRSDTIDWKKFNKNYFPVSLRQREGKENSLGLVKFVFDNPYAVFIHDTNAKRLFNNKVRTFSHGCIRMEKAIDFAHYLVTNDISAKSTVLEGYLARKEKRTISISQQVPVYVRYFTSWVHDGQLFVYDDCYGRDKMIGSAFLE